MVIISINDVEKYWKVTENEEYINHRNVTGEVMAVLYALKIAQEKKIKCIEFYYDYEGIEKWITGEWRTKTKLTKLYREKFFELSKGIKVKFKKVRSHTGIKYNELADKLAKIAIETNSSNIDVEVKI